MGLRGDRLREAREKKGLAQRELARECGLAFNMIYRYEHELTDPSVSTLEIIAKKLEVSLDYLVDLSPFPHGQMSDSTLTEDEQDVIEVLRREGWPGVFRLGAERISK